MKSDNIYLTRMSLRRDPWFVGRSKKNFGKPRKLGGDFTSFEEQTIV